MQNIRIVIVDAHPIFRDGLRRLLEAEPGFEVVGESGNATDAVPRIRTLSPDVLLLDLALPDGTGLDVLRAVGRWNGVRPILLTAAADKRETIEALQLGARGLVLKDSATALLHKCIRVVVSGEYWFGRDRMPDLVDALRQLHENPAATPAQTLTRREVHVIAAVLNGATNRDISEQLGLSEQTVKNHLSHIFDKLGVSNRLELALYAIHHKLLPERPAVSS